MVSRAALPEFVCDACKTVVPVPSGDEVLFRHLLTVEQQAEDPDGGGFLMRFLLIDRITDLESGLRATGLKNVTLSEDFFTHHFPAHPIMPGALITECLVQLSDWLLRETNDFSCISFPCRIELVKFHQLVRPGDQLRLEVQILGRENGLFQIRGAARSQDQVAASAQLEMRTLPAADFQSPEEARAIYRMLRGTPGQ